MDRKATPKQDYGPYEDAGQAAEQVDALLHGFPTPPSESARGTLVLRAALLGAGVKTSPYEQKRCEEIAAALSTTDAQIIAGWLMRARASVDDGRRPTPGAWRNG